jgi:hypothetical protein
MENMDELTVRSAPISSKKFIGARVKNGNDEDLGVVKELLIDPANGYVVQLIMDTGSAIGFKKPIGLSWDMLSFDGEHIHVNLDKEFIKHVPAYDETHVIEQQ